MLLLSKCHTFAAETTQSVSKLYNKHKKSNFMEALRFQVVGEAFKKKPLDVKAPSERP